MRAWLLFLPVLSLLTSGCTAMLWQHTDWDCHPAPQPRVELFNATREKDVLVVYDEKSDRSKVIRRRAYLLRHNEKRIINQWQPVFVTPASVGRLEPIPTFFSVNDATNPPPYFAVVATNAMSFTLFTNQVPLGIHDLPWYQDPMGQRERAICAPVAVTIDAAIVAGIVYGALLYYTDGNFLYPP